MNLKLISFSLVILSLSYGTNKVGDNPKIERGCDLKFTVTKIDSTKRLYVIYAKKLDTLYKIISHKDSSSSDCVRIKVGKSYNLNIKSVFANSASLLHINAYKYENDVVRIGDKGTLWDLFYCDNLKGLCYNKSW